MGRLKMKKIVSFSFALMMVLGLSFSVHAWNPDMNGCYSYNFLDLGVSIKLPKDMYIFTRGMKPDSPDLITFGYTPEEIDNELKKYDEHLWAWPSDLTYELSIRVNPTDNNDLASYGDNEFNNFKTALQEGYEEQGTQINSITDFYSGRVRFLKIDYCYSGEDLIYGIDCLTFYCEERIHVELVSYGEPLSSAAISLFNDILENMSISTPMGRLSTPDFKVTSTPSSRESVSSVQSKVTSSVAAVSSAQSTSSIALSPDPGTLTTAQVIMRYIRSSIWAVLLTLIIYAAPVIIYRFTNIKCAVEPKKAIKITIFYGVGAVVATSFLAVFSFIGFTCVGVVVLWSFVNFFILSSGKKEAATMIIENREQPQEWYNQNTALPEQKPVEEIPEKTEPETDLLKLTESDNGQNDSMGTVPPNFCENCGAKLRLGSKFCPKCGEKVEPNTQE